MLHCPQCSELLPFGTKRCNYCHEEIDEERGELNTTIHFALTAATSSANTIGTIDPAVFIYFGATLLGLWLKWMSINKGLYYAWVALEVFNVIWLLPLVGIVLWLIVYGRLPIVEDEYEQKKKAMHQSLAMWLAACAFHYIATFSII